MSALADLRYDDGAVQLDQMAITLRRYHFPSGTAKVIGLDQIRGYKAEPLGLITVRFNIWGSPDLRRWLPLDLYRPLKSMLITLDIPGSQPAFTPARPEDFLSCLDELLGKRGWPPAEWIILVPSLRPLAKILSGGWFALAPMTCGN